MQINTNDILILTAGIGIAFLLLNQNKSTVVPKINRSSATESQKDDIVMDISKNGISRNYLNSTNLLIWPQNFANTETDAKKFTGKDVLTNLIEGVLRSFTDIQLLQKVEPTQIPISGYVPKRQIAFDGKYYRSYPAGPPQTPTEFAYTQNFLQRFINTIFLDTNYKTKVDPSFAEDLQTIFSIYYSKPNYNNYYGSVYKKKNK